MESLNYVGRSKCQFWCHLPTDVCLWDGDHRTFWQVQDKNIHQTWNVVTLMKLNFKVQFCALKLKKEKQGKSPVRKGEGKEGHFKVKKILPVKKKTYKCLEKRTIWSWRRRRLKEKKSGKYLEREEPFLKDQIVPLFKYFPLFLIQSPISPEREWEWRKKSFKYLERGAVWSWRRMKEEKGKYFEKEIIALSGDKKNENKKYHQILMLLK